MAAYTCFLPLRDYASNFPSLVIHTGVETIPFFLEAGGRGRCGRRAGLLSPHGDADRLLVSGCPHSTPKETNNVNMMGV